MIISNEITLEDDILTISPYFPFKDFDAPEIELLIIRVFRIGDTQETQEIDPYNLDIKPTVECFIIDSNP